VFDVPAVKAVGKKCGSFPEHDVTNAVMLVDRILRERSMGRIIGSGFQP